LNRKATYHFLSVLKWASSADLGTWETTVGQRTGDDGIEVECMGQKRTVGDEKYKKSRRRLGQDGKA
jgi:hypothetical protein